MLALAALPCAIHAQARHERAAAGTEAAPWLSEVLDLDPYPLDGTFNGGRFIRQKLADFGAHADADYLGRAGARLANGDLVVAGLTPPYNQANQANGLWNLGLRRVSPAGSPRAWTDAGFYGSFLDQNLIVPGSASSRIQYVRDVKVLNGYIYVLADVQQSFSGLGRQDVYVYSFSDAGRLIGSTRVFGTGGGGATDPVDFYGVSLVPISGNRLIVVAQAYESAGPLVAASRLVVTSSGAYQGFAGTDTGWGFAYTGDPDTRLVPFTAPSNLCLGGGSRCNAVPTAATRAVGTASDDVYVTGVVQYSGTNQDIFVPKFSGESGQRVADFGGDGWISEFYDIAYTDGDDRARAIYVYQNELYVAATIPQRCQNGIGVLRRYASTGGANNSFGSGGKLLSGGSNGGTGSVAVCIAGAPSYDIYAMDATPGRLGIAGVARIAPLSGGVRYDPALAVVRADSGEVLGTDTYTVTYVPGESNPGARAGDGVLYNIIGGTGATFTVVGDGRTGSEGNRTRFLVGRMIPVSADAIFTDGFE